MMGASSGEVNGIVMWWLSLLHKFIQQILDAAQAQILLAACKRFVMLRISDNGLDWK